MAWAMTIFSPEPSENRQGMTVLTIPLSEPSGAKSLETKENDGHDDPDDCLHTSRGSPVGVYGLGSGLVKEIDYEWEDGPKSS
jgi:hypothetical protein